MRNKRDVDHHGQIPTKLKTINSEIFDKGKKAIYALLECFVGEPGSFRQKNLIIIAASAFERISCLVYLGENGRYKKPSAEKYCKDIFEGFAETPEEVYHRVKRFGVSEEKAGHIFKLVWQAAGLVCPMMACVEERAFVSEYAYAIEYVMKHDGDLPVPEFSGFFPINYPDFSPTDGIAEEIEKYDLF